MDIVTHPSVVAIPASKGRTAYIDAIDADLGEHRWHYSGGYVRRTIGHHDGVENLHRVILERKLGRPIQDGMQVDHIDGDPLNNCRSNLREVTPLQNRYNKRVQVISSHGYKGAILDRSRKSKPYVARIRANGKRLTLGAFATAEGAGRAYDAAARHYFGEYARLNFPSE